MNRPFPDLPLRPILPWLLLGFAFSLPLTLVAAQIFAYGSVLVWAWVTAKERGASLRPEFLAPVALGGLLYAALCLASIPTSIHPEHSLAKSYRLSLVLLVPAVLRATRGSPGLARRMASALVVGCAFRGGYDLVRFPLYVWVHHHPAPDFGNMRDPQFYMVAVFLALAALRMRYSEGVRPRQLWCLVLALTLCLLGVVLHQKRGVWMAFSLAFVLLTLIWRKGRWLLLLGAGAVLIAVLPVTRDRLRDLGDIWNPKRGDRALIWKKIAPKLIAAHPWGLGYKALTNADLKAVHPGVQAKLDHLHNNWLQVKVELGWIGLVEWTAWMGAILMAFFRARHHPDPPVRLLAAGAATAFCGLLLNGLVESNFGDGEIFMLILLLAGMAGALGANQREIVQTR